MRRNAQMATAAVTLALMAAFLAGCTAKPDKGSQPPTEQRMTAAQMDEMEKQVVSQFPAKIVQ